MLATTLPAALAALRTPADLGPFLQRLGWSPAPPGPPLVVSGPGPVRPSGTMSPGHDAHPGTPPPDAAALTPPVLVATGTPGAGPGESFIWVAAGARGAVTAAAAAALARDMAARAPAAGAAVLDLAARRLHLAVRHPAPATLTIALDAPSAVACAQLARCRPADGLLATAARVHDALAGRGVDHRFFAAFRAALDAMAASLPGPAAAELRHAYALLQLVRVLFLYFVQSRGWLDGRDDFLPRALDATLAAGRPVHRSLLRPLFFGTLDRPAARRAPRARAFGAIPYLNGGLFTPHPLDRRWPDGPTDAAWRDAFDRCFEPFHFTVREGSGHAVAPDMLGRVFEGVMVPEARRRTGTFYTPASLVQGVLHAALVPLVAARAGLGEGAADRALAERDARAAAALREVTLLDPACGSGAFLLGALDLLARLAAANGTTAADAKRAILARQLFGVDLEPGAVRLCELRLWLSLLADEPDAPAARVRPLPNLDALVRQGDSLLDPVGPARPDRRPAVQLARLRAAVVRRHGEAARTAIRRLRRAELAMARAALQERLDGCEARLHELLALARNVTLLDRQRGLDAAERHALATLRTERRTLRALARGLARDGQVPWFRYETHFADIAARGGFDVVLGNPPWVRGELLPRRLREQLAERYRWFRRPAGAGFAPLPDLAVAFVERSLELTAPAGVTALLVPAKLATTAWGTALRGGVAARHTLHRLAAVPPRGAEAFDATVYPLALVVGAGPAPAGHQVRCGFGPTAESRPQAEFGAGPWTLGAGGTPALLARLAARHPALGAQARLVLGVKTGCDRAFLLEPAAAAALPAALHRPALRGRDLGRFSCTPRLALLLACDPRGRPLPRVPAAVDRQLAPYAAPLARRRDLQGGPPWTVFRTGQLGHRHRVVWADLGLRLRAVALTDGDTTSPVALNTCYVAGVPDAGAAHALAAWLNAPLTTALARIGASPAAGGFARFGLRIVGALPLPADALHDAELRALGRARADDAALDARVAALLGLAEDEARALRDWLEDDLRRWHRAPAPA